MNRVIKNLLVVFAILFPIGIVMAVAGWLMGGRGFSIDRDFGLNTEREVYTYENMEMEEFKSIKVNVRNATVVIKKHDNNGYGVNIALEDNGDSDEYVEVKNNCLYINEKKVNNTFINFGFGGFREKTYVEIYVPQEQLDNVDVRTSNGSVELADVEMLRGNIKTSNGSVTIEDVSCNGSFGVDTSNGAISALSCDFEEAEFETSNGKIEADDCYFEKDSDMKTSNGSIHFDCSESEEKYSYYMKTSNGKVIVNGKSKGKEYENDGGDVHLNLKTSNGSIKVRFAEDND